MSHRGYKEGIAKHLRFYLWSLAVFCYFFQVPFRGIAKFIVPTLLLLIILYSLELKIKRDTYYLGLLICYFIYLGFEIFMAGLNNFEPSTVLRFLQILSIIPICYFIRVKNFNIYFKVTVFFAVLKALMLIGIGIYLLIIGSHSLMRNWIFSINGGDIYLSNGIPKVQLQGNGLLPFILILYCCKYKRIDLVVLILGTGVIFAGNFAFVLALLCYIGFVVIDLIKKDKRLYKIAFILLICLLAFPFFLWYMNKKIEQKSSFSNAVRIEQARILLDTNPIIGRGLGNYIRGSGKFVNYDGQIYYEMQTLYIFNQIGAFGLLSFYLLTIFGIQDVKYQRKRIALYLIYLFYTFWNPYCFDTTQMMAIILFINIDFDSQKIQKKSIMQRTQNFLALKYILK